MEHRWSIRKPYQCGVIIDCPRGGPTRATLCDIGIGGMFVETGNVDLPANACINVAFTLGGDDHREYFRLPAMVVRRTSKGAGIMFLESEVDAVRTLRRALYSVTAALYQKPPHDQRDATELDIRIVHVSGEPESHEIAAAS